MAKSALLSITEQVKERSYTYVFDGEEYEYTFRVLPVKEVLALQKKMDGLRTIRKGKRVTEKQREELYGVFVDLIKLLYVPTDEERELGLVMDGDVVMRFMLQAGGEDFFSSELLKNITYHLVGRDVSDEEIEAVEADIDAEVDAKKKR